jgi:hypothetical protein
VQDSAFCNTHEFYPVTVAYVSRDTKGGVLKGDGKESLEAKFFNPTELPEGRNPLIVNLIK